MPQRYNFRIEASFNQILPQQQELICVEYVSWLAFSLFSQVMTTFMPPPPASTFLAFHPQDNNIIAIGMEDSTIHIYNVRVDEVINSFEIVITDFHKDDISILNFWFSFVCKRCDELIATISLLHSKFFF